MILISCSSLADMSSLSVPSIHMVIIISIVALYEYVINENVEKKGTKDRTLGNTHFYFFPLAQVTINFYPLKSPLSWINNNASQLSP